MESRKENNERHAKVDEMDDLSVLREQLSELMWDSCMEEEKIKNLKALLDEYVSKLSEEMFETDAVVNRVMKKLGLYSHKATIEPLLQDFNTWFQDMQKNPTNWEDKPVEKLTLSLKGVPICSPELETINKLIGRNIKCLELQISDLETKKQWSKGEPKFFKTVRMLLENVEKLHLKLEDRKYDPGYMTTADISENIFSNGSALTKLNGLSLTLTRSIDFAVLSKFPALQELILTGVDDGSGGPGKFPALFTHLGSIRFNESKTNPDFLNLKTLDTIRVPIDSLRGLELANLVELEHLALSLTRIVSKDQLEACLNNCRDNLKSLKLLRGNAIAFDPFNYLDLSGKLDNLTELELWGKLLTNLEFLWNTPHIVKFRVDYSCFECPYYSGEVSDRPNVFQGDIVKNASALDWRTVNLCPKLEVFVTDSKMTSYSLDVLSLWLPSVRVLEAPLPNNRSFWIVCDCMKKLEKLRLRFGSEVDDGIFYRTESSFCRGISKLEYLQSFELEVECGQGKLTDKSAKLGFLGMRSLRSLKLGFTGNLLTDEMEKRLRERIEQVELYRSCSKTCEGGKVQKCCEWADFKRDWNIV